MRKHDQDIIIDAHGDLPILLSMTGFVLAIFTGDLPHAQCFEFEKGRSSITKIQK
jgi:hypothetical protein